MTKGAVCNFFSLPSLEKQPYRSTVKAAYKVVCVGTVLIYSPIVLTVGL